MSDSSDNFDAYVSLLKRVRIVSSNSPQSKECLIAFTHVNFVLDEAQKPAAQDIAGQVQQ